MSSKFILLTVIITLSVVGLYQLTKASRLRMVFFNHFADRILIRYSLRNHGIDF